jgi:rhodanese-related sulfurtransferase
MYAFTRRILLGTLLLSALAVCAESKEKFRLIQVTDLEALQKDAQHPVAIFDANDPEFRAKNGVIPGATLLASSHDYDLKVLPGDKATPLVFYCSNSK